MYTEILRTKIEGWEHYSVKRQTERQSDKMRKTFEQTNRQKRNI